MPLPLRQIPGPSQKQRRLLGELRIQPRCHPIYGKFRDPSEVTPATWRTSTPSLMPLPLRQIPGQQSPILKPLQLRQIPGLRSNAGYQAGFDLNPDATHTMENSGPPARDTAGYWAKKSQLQLRCHSNYGKSRNPWSKCRLLGKTSTDKPDATSITANPRVCSMPATRQEQHRQA